MLDELDKALGAVVQQVLDSPPDGVAQRNWEAIAAFGAIREIWAKRTKRKALTTAGSTTRFGRFAEAVFDALELDSATSAAQSWSELQTSGKIRTEV